MNATIHCGNNAFFFVTKTIIAKDIIQMTFLNIH